VVVQSGGALSIPGSNNTFSGNVTIDGNLTTGNAQLSIGNGATFTINNTATCSNGTSFTGQGTLAIGSAATLQSQTSGPDNQITCAGFTNAGSITVATGRLSIESGTNSGMIDASALGASVGIPVVRGMTNASGGILKGTFVVSGTLTINGPLNFAGIHPYERKLYRNGQWHGSGHLPQWKFCDGPGRKFQRTRDFWPGTRRSSCANSRTPVRSTRRHRPPAVLDDHAPAKQFDMLKAPNTAMADAKAATSVILAKYLRDQNSRAQVGFRGKNHRNVFVLGLLRNRTGR
jgi:hypothetical protein